MEENSEIKSEKNYFNEDYNIKVDEYHKMKFKSEKENINNPTKNEIVELTHFIKYPSLLIKTFSYNIQNKLPECLCIRIEKLDYLIATSYTNGKILIYNKIKSTTEKVLLPDPKEKDFYNYSDFDLDCNSNTFPAICSIRWKPHLNLIPKNILLSINTEGGITYWHTSSGKILYSFEEKNTALLSLDFNLEGNIFAVGCEDQTVRIYDENIKTISHKILPGGIYTSGHMSRINSVCFHKEELHKNLLLSGGWDQRVILYDIRTKKFQATISGPYIMGDSIDVRGNYIMTGSYSPKYKVQIWDIRNLKLELSRPESINEETNIYSVQFSKNKNKSQYAIAGSSENIFKVYNYEENFKKNDLYLSSRFLDKPCYTLDYSNEGDYIAFSGADSNIRIINL